MNLRKLSDIKSDQAEVTRLRELRSESGLTKEVYADAIGPCFQDVNAFGEIGIDENDPDQEWGRENWWDDVVKAYEDAA